MYSILVYDIFNFFAGFIQETLIFSNEEPDNCPNLTILSVILSKIWHFEANTKLRYAALRISHTFPVIKNDN